MKNILFLLLAAISFTYAQSQKISAANVPSPVLASFASKFSNAGKVTWEKESPKEYEGVFHQNGVEHSAKFDLNGNWMETESVISISELPDSVRNVIAKSYPGYTIEEANRVEHKTYGQCYEVEIKKGKTEFDVLLSATGKLLKKETPDDKDVDR